MGVMNNAAIASQLADTAFRLDLVRKDPAVVKSARQALADVRRAAKSTTECAVEVNSAWHRSRGARSHQLG